MRLDNVFSPIGMKMQSETDSVKYSIDEVASILTELSNIQNAINNLQKRI